MKQPQKYSQLGGLLLLRAWHAREKRRLQREKSQGDDNQTQSGGGEANTSTSTTAKEPEGNAENHVKGQAPRQPRPSITPAQREQNMKKRRLREAKDLVKINRDLDHILSLPRQAGSDDDLKGVRDRRFQLLRNRIVVTNEVIAISGNALSTVPFGDRLKKALRAVLILEREEDFGAAIPALEKLYQRLARRLQPEHRQAIQNEVSRQLDLFGDDGV